MGIDVQLQTENGEVLEELGDPKGLVAQLLPAWDDPKSFCMRFIDPCGDTVFNSLRMPILIEELEIAIEKANYTAAKEFGKRLRELARRASSGPHLYLKFIGD